MKIRKRVEDSEEQLFLYQRREFLRLNRRIAQAVKERKKTPAICKGPKAENLVRAKLEENCRLLTVEGPENHIDIIGLKVEGNHLKYPLEIVGVEVENFPLTSHSVKITAPKLREKNGSFFVIVVETDFGEYSYLVYTYREMKQFLRDKKVYDGTYQFSVPRTALKEDEEYRSYYEKWEKIAEAVYE